MDSSFIHNQPSFALKYDLVILSALVGSFDNFPHIEQLNINLDWLICVTLRGKREVLRDDDSVRTWKFRPNDSSHQTVEKSSVNRWCLIVRSDFVYWIVVRC